MRTVIRLNHFKMTLDKDFTDSITSTPSDEMLCDIEGSVLLFYPPISSLF